MKHGLFRRIVSALLTLCILVGLAPMSGFATAGETKTSATRAATDLTSKINGLSAPIKQTNAFLTVNDSNKGSLGGTYFLVNQNDDGILHILDARSDSKSGNFSGIEVTKSGTSLVGADIDCAIDVVMNGSELYLINQNGKYLTADVMNNAPCINLTTTASTSYGIGIASGARPVFYRFLTVASVRSRYDFMFDTTDGFHWIKNVGGYYPASHTTYFYKVAQRWDTEQLYNAIQTMKSFASANNGRYPEALHQAFMECMDASIALYNRYNVATGSETYEQVVAIRKELKAQTQWLLSYQNVLKASYAEAVAALPEIYNEHFPISFKDFSTHSASSFANNTYYVVNLSADGKSGKLLDLSGDNETQNYITSNDVTIANNSVIGAEANMSIKILVGQQSYWVRFEPTYGLGITLNGLSDDQQYFNLTDGKTDAAIRYHDGKISFAVHPWDLDGDGAKEYYFLTYKSDINGFRFWANYEHSANADNGFALYKVADQAIALNNAIHGVEHLITGNADGRYPEELYSEFLTCLNDSIKLYQQYNLALNETDEAKYATIKKSMDDQAAELLGYRAKLTTADTTAEYIDIPMELYDFRADGLFFEYMYAYYNLGSAPGSPSSHGRLGLTYQNLTNRQIAYKKEVIDYVVDAFYNINSISKEDATTGVRTYTGDTLDANAPGWNDTFYNMLPTISATPLPKGSYEETIRKTSTQQNGGELLWEKVTTYYDLAYYLLTYLWRPVNSADIVDTENNLPYNTTITERDRLRLYADDNGNYTLDAAYNIAQDGYYIYNTYPRIESEKEIRSAFFTPADGLGFETDEILNKVGGDTDRGTAYSQAYDHEMENTNFHFTMHAYGSFVYYESQNLYFDFVGDDDVYFFIDGKMALDIGGAHQALGARINLNSLAGTLGLIDGEVYDFDMFYAERHTTASNLKFSTNIKIVDTDTLTTMGQYALTYNGASKIDPTSGMGAPIIDNGAVFVDDTTAYSFDLTNTRKLPVYNLSFVSPTLGANISKDSLTLYKPDLSNGAVTNITDITVYYRTITQDENDNNIINASSATAKSYADMKSMLTTIISKNTTLAEGCYSVAISSETELKALLELGIPHNCQISIYGFKRNTTQNDTPYTNKLTSQCNYTRVANNEGSANGEVFTLNGSASRMLRVSSALPSINTQQMVLDYGKAVEIPISNIAESISTDSFVSVTGFEGITFSGNHGEVLKNLPTEFGLGKVGQTWRTEIGTFTRTENGLQFHLTDFFDEIQNVYLVYSLSGCEVSDPDGSLTSYKYFLVQLQLIPATSVYYETDFTDGVFDLNAQSGTMFFDFTNTTEEQLRFSGAPYGGHNFSQEENGYWATRSTRSDAATVSDFVIDNDAGTISIDVAPGRPYNDTANYGPWFTTTHVYGNYPAVSNGKYHPLKYIPTDAEYIQIRFKVEGCKTVSSANPRLVVVYDYLKDGVYPGTLFEGRDYTMIGEYVYKEGVYQTVTIPVSENFKNADLVTTFGFRFWDLVSVDNGKITVDYIYVGNAESLPGQVDYLYFDFDNRSDAQNRYASDVYNFTNFDDQTKTSTNWALKSPVKSVSMDNSSGTLQLELKTLGTDSYPGFYTISGQLNFSPKKAEIFEIRFKMENLVQGTQGTSKKAPYFAVGVYETIGGSNITLSNVPDVPLEHIADGQWITIRRDLRNNEALKGVSNIASLRLYFGGIESDLTAFAELGKITIDYIYMGPEADAPTPDYLYFDFTGTQSDRERYENPIYGGFNYDNGNWATSANGGSSKYTIDHDAGTVTVNVQNRESDFGPYFATTNTAGQYPSQNNGTYAPLNYPMPVNAVLQIRFKVSGAFAVPDKTPNIGLLMHYTNAAGERKYTSADSLGLTYTITDNAENPYITLKVPLKGTFKGTEILHSVGIRFRNLDTESSGSITIDYIFVGREEDILAPNYLYFGFGNSDQDQTRYQDPIYGGFNFDVANWALGATSGASAFKMNNAEGTITIPVQDRSDDYGPYFATSNKTGSYPWSGSPQYAPLQYPMPANAVLKIRFKVDNCTVTEGNPNIAVLLHYTNAAGEKLYSTSLGKTYTYVENEYLILTVPLQSVLKGTEVLNTVGVRFRKLDGTGTVTVDYIYVGREEDFARAIDSTKTWQTVTDGTTADHFQDSGVANEQMTYSVGKATTIEEVKRTASFRAANTYTPPSSMTLKSKSDKTLMEGVNESTITLTHNSKNLAVFATTINADAQATIKMSYAGYYSAGSTEESRQALNGNLAWNTMRTTAQAADYENATGNTVLFAMNGGFPKSGASRGPLVIEGNLIQPFLSTIKDEPMFAVLKDGTYAIMDYTDDFSNIEEALGLRQWLVKDGVNFAATYTEADEEDNLIFPTHPRTAIGIKADGSVVCVVVDGRQAGYSDLGVTLKDLADLMISLGCVSAANMDGGGSSTFASRYSENEELTIRNSPSDAAGEREVITAMFLISTEDQCQHDYTSNTYAISNDGRHNRICDICRQGIDSPHRYENGVCVCGKTEEVSPNLFFDFTNNDADRERYMTGAYGYRNYDRTQYGNWWQSYWATKASSSKEHLYGDFKINENNGTLVVNVADGTGADGTATGGRPYGDSGNWGPWVSTAYAYRENPDRYTANTMSLNYDPSQAEIVEIRFKVTGCSLAGTVTKPKVVVVCDYLEGTTLKRDTAYDMRQNYTYVDGEYVTITMELCEHLKNADAIKSFGFRFWDIYSTLPESDANRGKVTIDYIYVGTREDAPKPDDYFFVDFTNTKDDQERYSGYTYGGLNLDLAENWSTITFSKPVISDGVLTVTPGAGFTGYGVLNPGHVRTAKPLNYIPSADDYYQIRFRIDDATSSDLRVKGTGRVVLFYSADPAVSNEQNFVYYDFKVADEIIDKGWVTLTFKLSDMVYNKDGVKYENMSVINAFTPCFNWIVSAEGKTATYQIDYLYVGPESKLPSFNQPVYGYDSSYTDDSKLSNGSSLFIEGAGVPNYDADKKPIYKRGQNYSMTSFTFTGTGFDIISRTGANQGAIRVSVYDTKGNHIRTATVLNKSDNNLELYQIPVISIEGLTHGTYRVYIFVNAAYDYDNDDDPTNGDNLNGALDRGGEFYFDAVRIYNPIDTKANTLDAQTAYSVYQAHAEADARKKEIRQMLITAGNFNAGGTMEGVVYLDAPSSADKTAVANYQEVGPNNEVYLASGKAIAFKLVVDGKIPASVDIGAKCVNGDASSMTISISSQAPTNKPTGDARIISTSTQQYYPLNILPSAWKTSSNQRYVYIVIYNSGTSGILSLTDIKYAFDEPNPETKSVRFLVDLDMVNSMNVCQEHVLSYTNLGKNHAETCANCSITNTLEHEYVNAYCICGAAEIVAPMLDENLKFNMNISAGAEMVVNYNFMAAVVNKYTDFYLEVSKKVAGGDPIVTTYGITADHIALGSMNNPATGEAMMYNAAYTGIYAKEMGDEFATTLYAIDADGKVYRGETVVSSIKDFLLGKLEDENSIPEMKTMAVDMLKYGAAAQINFGYDTDNLVTAELSNAQLAYATQDIPEAVDSFSVSGEGANVNTNITVKSKVELNLSCIVAGLANPAGVKCVITDLDGNVLAELATANIGGVMYSATYDNVGAKQMRNVITATFYDADGNAISKTVNWSVESYVAQTRAKTGATANEIAVVNAMLTYGDSVAVYLESMGQ